MNLLLDGATPLLVATGVMLNANVASSGTLSVRLHDAGTQKPLAARVYLENDQGEFFTAQSQDATGSAVVYQRVRDGRGEHHTTVSAHPFQADLEPGRYHLTVERGKEYVPTRVEVDLSGNSTELNVGLNRWTDMVAKGWYSGDTHVHRSVDELPNLLLAEDLNVALPLTYWVTEFTETPSNNSRPNPAAVPTAELIRVDANHVIWPINTEYEIFTVDRKRHTLGAVFVLNHREPINLRAHPAKTVAAEARRQGAILDMDKHNWPWSMMLLPVMDVDLYELSNNHVWRTDFAFTHWYPEYFPSYLGLEGSPAGYTEEDWLHWGFGNYYALLNCGFDLMPSAGTASGVHPVPLGFGRVYVYLGEQFDFERWMSGLEAGRSFVTTGPMLEVQFNGQLPGSRFRGNESTELQVEGNVSWYRPVERVEILANGKVVETIRPNPASTVRSGLSHSASFSSRVALESTSWVAVRCFARMESGRIRFAHTAPVHFDLRGRPLPVQVDEVSYLEKRVADELERHRDVLPAEALVEYESARQFYRDRLNQATSGN